jgi:hypothetical protein
MLAPFSHVWLHFYRLPLPTTPYTQCNALTTPIRIDFRSPIDRRRSDSRHTLLANGQFAQKPYISGNVKDEGTTFVPTAVSSEAQLGLFVNVLEPIAPDNATLAQLLQLYPNDPTVGS